MGTLFLGEFIISCLVLARMALSSTEGQTLLVSAMLGKGIRFYVFEVFFLGSFPVSSPALSCVVLGDIRSEEIVIGGLVCARGISLFLLVTS